MTIRQAVCKQLARWGLLATVALAAALGSVAVRSASAGEKTGRLNVLLITADDMNWDSLGVTGCKIPNITPNLDRLAGQGMRFLHGHVTIAVCQPCREVLMTGRYPDRNGGRGFEPIRPDVPTLQESLRAAGYLNGIMAKVPHLAPQPKFCWDVVVSGGQLGRGRNPKLYYQRAKAFFKQAKAEGRPFFLMANAQDPHRPLAGSQQENRRQQPKPKPRQANSGDKQQKQKPRRAKNSDKQRPRRAKPKAKTVPWPNLTRVIRPEEVEVPGFLPDIPEVRREVAQYFTSVHRCDQVVGAVLRALRETGLAESTLVMFLSDNGMAFPFAKTNVYLTSTRTPWIVRWPGVVRPGVIDREHFISGIDFMPTILDALGLAEVEGMDGRSFVPVLRGEKQPWRDHVYTVFHQTSARRDYEMRSIQTARFGYIFNPWSDGKTVFLNESQSGLTFRAMQRAAETDPAIAARVKLFQYRVPEEFYDYRNDPCALENLIDNPRYKEEIARLRARMLKIMRSIDDPLFEQLEARASGK